MEARYEYTNTCGSEQPIWRLKKSCFYCGVLIWLFVIGWTYRRWSLRRSSENIVSSGIWLQKCLKYQTVADTNTFQVNTNVWRRTRHLNGTRMGSSHCKSTCFGWQVKHSSVKLGPRSACLWVHSLKFPLSVWSPGKPI